MNPTLKRFNHPAGLVRELEHWVVLIRPATLDRWRALLADRWTH
jgi:hypothetical protein